MKKSKRDILVAKALRNFANIIMDNDSLVETEEARALDRALRSCPAISDIDPIWVRWRFVGSKRGWITSSEMVCTKHGRYEYPSSFYKEDSYDYVNEHVNEK
jgi:hypothetical protein